MIKVLPSAENFSAVWVNNFCLWVISLALLRMGKSWLQQLLAKAGAQSGFSSIAQTVHWMQKELLLLQLRCGLYLSAVTLPFPESWAMLQSVMCNSMTISAIFCQVSPWGENPHICASPDSLHLGLQTDEEICCPAELLQAPRSSSWRSNGKTRPASTFQPRLTPQSLDPCHGGAPKWRHWWAEWCGAIENVTHQKTYTGTMYQTFHSSSPDVNP